MTDQGLEYHPLREGAEPKTKKQPRKEAVPMTDQGLEP
jgi:hypothetical protein